MSHEATIWAVKVRGISCTEARVLWHLADCHNPIFGCYPKQDYLADACEIDERSVRRSLAWLRDKGLVNWVEQREGKNRKANRYSLAFEPGFRPFEGGDSAENEPDNLSGSSEASTGQECTLQPDSDGALNRTPESSIEPVREPVIEPVRERGRARELSEDDPKKIEKAFLKWHPTWPTYPNGSKDAALRCWFSLTAEQRAACIEKTPAFVAAVRAVKGGGFTYPAVYLKERAWERLSDPKDEIGPPTTHAPFSQPWMALLFSEVLKPMSTAWPAMTLFQSSLAASGPEGARTVEMERRSKYGWPKASRMIEDHKPVTVPALLVGISENFVGIDPNSDLAGRWKAMFERKGWPWPTSGFNRLQVPPGEPEQAMADLKGRITRERGDDDAA